MPASAPTGLRFHADPTALIVDDSPTGKGDQCGGAGGIVEVAPGRVPRLAEDVRGLLTEDVAHQIKVMNGHIRQQRLPDMVVRMALSWGAVARFAKYNAHRPHQPKRLLTQQRSDGLYCRMEAIVLTNHQDTLLLLR